MGFREFRLHMRFLSMSAALLLAASGPAPAQTSQSVPHPDKIVVDASWNELHPQGTSRPFRYRVAKVDSKGSTVKLVVETKEGDIARLIEKEGRPLTPQEDRAELARLDSLLAHPEIQERRHKKQQADNARGDEMVKMLPDAFLYTFEGMVQGPTGPCYRVSFKPNPAFVPPDREGEVYHGMVGELWVDQAQLRIVRLQSHLISDVNFGWGVLGKLYQGGSILVENRDVGLHHWETTHMKLHLQGKILMMKSVDFSTTEDYTDFSPVPMDSTYQDAIRMLKEKF
jgi:hypothetical protein